MQPHLGRVESVYVFIVSGALRRGVLDALLHHDHSTVPSNRPPVSPDKDHQTRPAGNPKAIARTALDVLPARPARTAANAALSAQAGGGVLGLPSTGNRFLRALNRDHCCSPISRSQLAT